MSTTPRKYLLKTLGCKANYYDSQLIEQALQKQGWIAAEGDGSDADLCVVNSCTVTDEADKQSRKAASRSAMLNPNAKVLLTGCGAEVDPAGYARVKGVNYVVGNQDKARLVGLLEEAIAVRGGEPILGGVTGYSQILSKHPMDRDWNEPESSFFVVPADARGETERTRSFLKIQEGCNSFCTYCIIPYGRGPGRSLPLPKLVEQVRLLAESGVQEIILTGTNIGDYGADLNAGTPMLEDLIEVLLRETNLPRLRMSSLDPVEISPRLRSIMAKNPRFCPHFHVSLQSPHSRILRLMKRKYAEEQVTACLQAIAELPAPIGGVFIGMDVITGFPGETDEVFEETYRLLESLPWTRLHVFPYSERKGTPATKLPNPVLETVRASRAKKLRALSLARMQVKHAEVLTELKRTGRGLDRVLIEGIVRGPDPKRVWVSGYSSNYLRVLFPVESTEQAAKMRNSVRSVQPESLLINANGGDLSFIGKVF